MRRPQETGRDRAPNTPISGAGREMAAPAAADPPKISRPGRGSAQCEAVDSESSRENARGGGPDLLRPLVGCTSASAHAATRLRPSSPSPSTSMRHGTCAFLPTARCLAVVGRGRRVLEGVLDGADAAAGRVGDLTVAGALGAHVGDLAALGGGEPLRLGRGLGCNFAWSTKRNCRLGLGRGLGVAEWRIVTGAWPLRCASAWMRRSCSAADATPWLSVGASPWRSVVLTRRAARGR